MNVSPEQAVRVYPELRQLAALRDGGWRFLPIGDPGELEGIVGYRNREGHIDAL